MQYQDFISSNNNFQSSVNLQFDLNKDNKIDSYIPTQQSVEILKRYLNAVCNDNYNEDNATVLIGPYGRGKSHLLLILSAIISGSIGGIDKNTLSGLHEKIKAADHSAGELTDILWNKKKPMLPVIINSNHTDINQSFIVALRASLERFNLNDFFPETYFDSALNMIETWENDYEKAFKTFRTELKKEKVKLHDFKDSLYKCSPEAYQLFCRIYPAVSNGAQFNPFSNTDIVKIYEQVTESLIEQKNIGGLFIIFDEFSKYLESFSAVNNMQNMKLIQDFAEIAVRNNHIHICCVTHKEILDYSQSDSFRTVDGRFKKVYFVASAEQSYELVANAIAHLSDFDEFYSRHKQDFWNIGQLCHLTGLFNDLPDEIYYQLIVKECFPLHPMSVYALIRISESVGQNERTLFTFLSQKEEYSFDSFLKKSRSEDEYELLTIEWIYDYFQELFRVEVFNPKIFNIWAKTQSAVKKCKNSAQIKLIKILAVCKMINNENFGASDINIKAASGFSDSEYRETISQLTAEHIITKKRDGLYEFLTPNGVDIKKNITNLIEQGLVKVNRPAILKEAYSTPFILPRQHNSKMRIFRYFTAVFMEISDFLNYSGNFSELKKNADGLLINLISENKYDEVTAAKHLESLYVDESIIICISDVWRHDDYLQEYQAICILEEKTKNLDDHFKEELQVYKYDLFKTIKDYADFLYSPSEPHTKYYTSKGYIDDISKPYQLNRAVSVICDRVYSSTPIINNEMVNKNNLTPQIRKARSKTIDHILSCPDKIAEIEGYGPEVSILRSAIIIKKLSVQNDSDDYSLNSAIQLIEKLVSDSEQGAISFDVIYQKLCSSPYGMRKGVIPVYIAYVMRKRLDSVIILYKNKEISLNGDTLSRIEDDPDNFSFYLETGTQEKSDYLESVLSLFAKNTNNSIGNRCNIAVESMQKWFRGLPKFAREHSCYYSLTEIEKVDSKIARLRKQLIQFDINPHAFLFCDVPKYFDSDNDYSETAFKLKEFVQASNHFIDNIKKYLIEKTKKLFDTKLNGSLSSIMNDWYDSLSEQTKSHVFSREVNAFLHYIRENRSHDDMEIISGLAKCLIMLAIEDWNDMTVGIFLDKVKEYIRIILEFKAEEKLPQENGTISLSINYSGQVFENNLTNTEISGIAETALNNIESDLNEYGDAITVQERIALLLRLIRKELEQL